MWNIKTPRHHIRQNFLFGEIILLEISQIKQWKTHHLNKLILTLSLWSRERKRSAYLTKKIDGELVEKKNYGMQDGDVCNRSRSLWMHKRMEICDIYIYLCQLGGKGKKRQVLGQKFCSLTPEISLYLLYSGYLVQGIVCVFRCRIEYGKTHIPEK